MRIGIISNIAEEWGGSEELWWAMAMEAVKRNHEIVVSYNSTGKTHPKIQQLIDLGCTCIGRRGVVKPGLSVSQRILRKVLIAVKNELNDPYAAFWKQRLDVIIYNDSSYNFSADKFFLQYTSRHTKPLFILNQVIPDQIRIINNSQRLKAIAVFNKSRKNFFVAQRNIDTAERQLAANIPASEVVRNPVNIARPALLPFPSLSTIRFASVANMFINHKAQDILLEALAMVKFRNENWQLEFYGSGVDTAFLRSLIKYYDLSGKAFIRGKTDTIDQVWKINHMLVMPSLMEGTSLAMVEAMLCGRPVLMSDVGGAREWVSDSKNGYLCSAASAISLAETLEKAFAERTRWEHMGMNAFNDAMTLSDPHPGLTLLNKILQAI